MSKRKKTFPCGHRGQGQYCHECERTVLEVQKLQSIEDGRSILLATERLVRKEKAKERKKTKQLAKKQNEPQLEYLPKAVVKKATKVWNELSSGADHRKFLGKKIKM